jgi:hypothetical protein
MKKIFKYIFVFFIFYLILTNPVFADSGWGSIFEIGEGGAGAGAGAGAGGSYIGEFLAGIFSAIVASIVVYIGIVKRRKERLKKNPEDRNFDGTHAELDKNHSSDKALINLIDATEDLTDDLFADYINNIADLEYVKNNSSTEFYERVRQFIEINKKQGKNLVVSDTVIVTNDIKEKENNRYISFIIFECYNYMVDSNGHYLCGYKRTKEFVRKKMIFEIVNKHLVIIAIDDL